MLRSLLNPVHLLRQAGYSSGDAVRPIHDGPNSTVSSSTTSTSYQGTASLSFLRVVWADHFPDAVQATVGGEARVAPGTDETVDIRIQNTGDGEPIAEQTGITEPTNVTLGPVPYTPTTTDQQTVLQWEWRTDPGTNSSTLSVPTIYAGPHL